MKVNFFCPRWGSEDVPWDRFLKAVKEAGFTGIEWFPDGASGQEIDQVLKLLIENQLTYSVVMAVVPKDNEFSSYRKLLRRQLLKYCQMGEHSIRPLFVTIQLGREYYSDPEIDTCIDICNQLEEKTGMRIYQETHRNKWSYAAHLLPAVVRRHPQLKLTLDVSHWFCVSESYLEDQQHIIALAINHTHHLHARVGHTQGSQVPDFEWPAYQEALKMHLAVWDQWIELNRKKGRDKCIITPEFGPPPYLILENGHASPQETQWNLNVRMMQLLDLRYNK